MPAVLAAPWFIPLIAGIGAAGTLTTTGLQLANSGGGGSSGPTAAEQAQTKAAQTLAQQKAAFLSNQAQGSQPSSASNGLATPTGSPTSMTDIQSMLKLLSPGGSATGSTNISGGIDGATTPPPQVTNGLTNLAV